MKLDQSRSGVTSAELWYLWIWGSMLMLLGIGSLIVNPDFGVGAHVSHDRMFGVFETNGWHGLVGALAGGFDEGFDFVAGQVVEYGVDSGLCQSDVRAGVFGHHAPFHTVTEKG